MLMRLIRLFRLIRLMRFSKPAGLYDPAKLRETEVEISWSQDKD